MGTAARPPLPAALTGLIVLLAAACWAAEGPGAKTVGWRGNWTGLYGDADPPIEWGRAVQGVLAGATCQAAKPAEAAPAGATKLDDGLIRDWLIIGPLAVGDSVKDFAAEQIPGEADLAPAAGEKVGRLAWQRHQLIKQPDYERWGTTELDWIDLAPVFEGKPNHVAYAHTYLHCRRAGKAMMVVEHGYGMKLWVNGKAVYSHAKNAGGLGSYVGISRQARAHVHSRSPEIIIDLKAGWNRVLVKVGSYNRKGWRVLRFAQRLMEIDPVAYADRNIVWATKLPDRTNASPILVGDRIFTPSEPDELLCVDKNTGRILWRRINSYYEAVAPKRRAAEAGFAKIAPLAAELAETYDDDKVLALRRKIDKLLVGIDKKAYGIKWDGHLASHFGIVGFTTTPVSDGKCVWAFYGQGVVACYDLEGNRKWIRRIEADEVRYSCSPALIGGRLVVIFGGMHCLDAATGRTVWSDPKVTSIASLIPARIAGVDVVFTRPGQVLRVADGKMLWSNPHIRKGDTGWAAPVILGDVMYLPWIGVNELIVADFAGVSGEAWKPALRLVGVGANNRRPDGKWLDRWTASSPLVADGIYYNIDQYGVFYALDLKTGKPLYKQDAGFDEMHSYNAIGVAASPTLGGKYIYVLDNQGACAVLRPGRSFRRVAVNHIRTELHRGWAMPPQEILANGAPLFDGGRMYLRGERHLYCIGKPSAGKAGGSAR